MRYLTPRKRAEGKGSAHAGAEHHWAMTVSSVALGFLVPAWLYVFGSTLGESQEVVVATFAEPFPAILTVLILVVGMRHFAMGATTMIEDYSRGASRKVLIIAVTLFAWATVATGLFALARIAL